MRLFIFGTGAHARKAYHCARSRGIEVAAFVDDSASAVAPVAGAGVLPAAALPAAAPGDALFVAIGRAEVRERLMRHWGERGWPLPPLVHASATVAPDARLGDGVLLAAGAVVETARIGRGAIVDIGVLVDHDSEVGDFCHLRPGEVLGPRTQRTAP